MLQLWVEWVQSFNGLQMVKNPPATQETRVWSLGQEVALEKGMATHSSILVWEISWTEEHGRLQSTGSQRVEQDWMTFTFHHLASEGSKSKSLYFLISLKPVSIPQFLHCIYLFTSLIGFPLFSHQSLLLVIARMILPKQIWSYYSETLN